MGDVDGGYAVSLQLLDQAKERLRLAFGDGGGGLVHDEDASLLGHCLGDLDHLASADAQCLHWCSWVDVLLKFGEDLPGASDGRRIVDEQPAGCARFVVEKDVLGDRQGRDETQLLED